MRRLSLLMMTVWTAGGVALADPPAPTSLQLGNTGKTATYMPHPHLSWTSVPEAAEHVIEIARDEGFGNVVDRDRIAVVSRYVPRGPLGAGGYFWRVRAVGADGSEGPWSQTAKFVVRGPERQFTIPTGARIGAIHSILQAAIEKSPSILRFEPGEYRVDPEGAEALLSLVDASDLIVDGQGASITLTGQCNIAKLWDSENVLVRNLTVDYDPVPYTAGRILAVNGKTGTFDIRIEPGHPDLDGNPKFLEEAISLIYDGERMRVKEGVPIVVATKTDFERFGPRQWRIRLAASKQHKLLAPGDVYINAPRGPAAFDVKNCRHVTFQGNTVYSTCGIGFSTHYASAMNILDHAFRRKEGRFLAVQNGGTNIHNSRIGPWVEGCWFENTGDDCNHINCLVMYVTEVVDDNCLALRSFRNQCPQARLDLLVLDELSFFDRSRGRELARRFIREIDYHRQRIVVTLDGPVPSIRTVDQKEPTQVFNMSRAAGQFVFRHNTFRRGRRLGILAKGYLGLIEKNRFLELGGAGVDIWNAPYEGPNADTVLIRDNVFERCGLAGNKSGVRWSIGSSVYRHGDADRWHRNLTIRDNLIVDSPTMAISIRDADHVRIENNRIENRELEAFRGPGPCAIELVNTVDVVLGQNRITDRRMESVTAPVRVLESERVRTGNE